MNYRDAVYISPGAAKRLGHYTADAEASSPLSPIRELHSRLSSAERAIAALCLEPDDAGGSRDPASGDPTDGETEDRRRRSRDNIGARSWSGKGGSGYEETDAAPDMDYTPAGERERVEQTHAGARRDGPNKRVSDSDASVPSPDTPASINAKNAAKWGRSEGTTTGGSGSVPLNSRKAEGGSFMPNSAGSIDVPRRASTTAQVPQMNGSKTWGVTGDSLKAAAFYRAQDAAAQSRVRAINAKNRAHYK